MPVRTPQKRLTQQVAAALRQMIELGELGEPFPPERQLAQLLGVSRVTMRRAMQLLAERGVVRREQGRGTYASSSSGPRIHRPDALAEQPRPVLAVLTEQDGPWFKPQLTPFTWHICRALREQVSARGGGLCLVNGEQLFSFLERRPQASPDMHLLGLVAPTHLWTARKYDAMLALGHPFVGIGRTSQGMYWNILDLQWNPGLTEALEDLSPGPSDRVFIPGDPYPKEIDRQVWLQSVLEELDRRGVPAGNIVVRAGGMFEPQGYLAMRWYLKEYGLPTLVLSDFDLSIAGVYRALAAACPQRPDRPLVGRAIRCLGAINMKIGRYLNPSLSTLYFRYDTIAARIVRMLDAQRERHQPVGLQYVSATYIRRGSSGSTREQSRMPSRKAHEPRR